MSARTAAATVEKSLPVESNIEAEISSLIEQQTPKRIQVEKQPPKRIQIEDDAERCRSFIARITSNSIDEVGELASELTSALQNLQEYLKAEGERVQRQIVDYAHLNHTALAAIKTIIETTRAPSNEKVEEHMSVTTAGV
jgi:chromosome condensin MukBEF complex kleisin-like MukF subunit